MLYNNTEKVIPENNTSDAVVEVNYIDPIFEYFLDEGFVMALYLGIKDIDPVTDNSGQSLEDGHLFYSRPKALFRIYDSGVWTNYGSTPGNGFCPGYTYTFVNTTTFRVDGFNVINLFNPGRRLKFTVDAGTMYGTITASDFNITSTGNSTIVVVMEDSALLTAGLTEVCLVAGTAGWSPIAGVQFGGTSINAVLSGKIGLQVWWVAVGDGGKLFTSEDKGLTWTARTSGTTEHLNCIAFDTTNQRFMVGGNAWTILTSTDGVAWAQDTAALALLDVSGSGNVIGTTWSPTISDGFSVLYSQSTSGNAFAFTNDFGVTWTENTAVQDELSRVFLYYAPTADIYLSSRNYEDLFLWGGQTFGDTLLFNQSFGITHSLRDATQNTVDGSAVVVGNRGAMYKNAASASLGFGWSLTATPSFGLTNISGVTHSDLLYPLFVAVGDSGKIAYSIDSGDTFIQVSNGLDPLANFTDVHYDEDDTVFIAVADNGQILRSTNGIN